MKYTINYFINKFEAIPDDEWTTNDFYDGESKYCALGHCGEDHYKQTPESKALLALAPYTGSVNDGFGKAESHTVAKYDVLRTPKERVLAYLEDVKKGLTG